MNFCPNCGSSLIQKNNTLECECCGYVATARTKPIDNMNATTSVTTKDDKTTTKSKSNIMREVKKCENIVASGNIESYAELMDVGSKLIVEYPDYLDGYYFYFLGLQEIVIPTIFESIRQRVSCFEDSSVFDDVDLYVKHDPKFEKTIVTYGKNKYYELQSVSTTINITQEEVDGLVESCNSQYNLIYSCEEIVSSIYSLRIDTRRAYNYEHDLEVAIKKKIAGVIVPFLAVVIAIINLAAFTSQSPQFDFFIILFVAGASLFTVFLGIQMVQIGKLKKTKNRKQYLYNCIRKELIKIKEMIGGEQI